MNEQETVLFSDLQRLGAYQPLLSKHHTSLYRISVLACNNSPKDLLSPEWGTGKDLQNATGRGFHTKTPDRCEMSPPAWWCLRTWQS